MKRIVYLTFYFKPDLSAGSFRNSTLALELASQAKLKGAFIDIYTTLPNRYSSFVTNASEFEEFDNVRIHRIPLPPHKSGMLDQAFSFFKFYKEVIKLNRNQKATLVFASSSRLFTAFLGYRIAKKSKARLYLDIRDIFVDTMNDVFKSKTHRILVLPLLKIIENITFKYAVHINLISGGFKDYFQKYNRNNFSFFSNGIDEEFLLHNQIELKSKSVGIKKTVVYAGNIGEGQGLHKIIPQAAFKLGNDFEFQIIGDGGAKKLLISEIYKLGVTNVIIKNPVNRNELKKVYFESDFLLLHLNDYPAFRKVLPSKIFELATFNKIILAGVSGYSAQFIKDEVSNSFVFEPCDIDSLVTYLINFQVQDNILREDFVNKFTRKRINKDMAESILSYI